MLENLNVLINEDDLQKRISELANEISNDYKNVEELVLVCILKGGAYFAVDLSKKLTNNTIILDFMKVSSYGNNLESTGNINFLLDTSVELNNKHVIIVEDILDSGITLSYLYEYLKTKNPKSLKICVLLNKTERRQKEIKTDYVGFEIENKFVIGYGLDFEDKYRNLPYIGYINN